MTDILDRTSTVRAESAPNYIDYWNSRVSANGAYVDEATYAELAALHPDTIAERVSTMSAVFRTFDRDVNGVFDRAFQDDSSVLVGFEEKPRVSRTVYIEESLVVADDGFFLPHMIHGTDVLATDALHYIETHRPENEQTANLAATLDYERRYMSAVFEDAVKGAKLVYPEQI